ncbi:MAG TPA: hypothetical protein VGR89_07465, partial [Puia sp.]|nr:hypothetical protein [Puia sp.]
MRTSRQTQSRTRKPAGQADIYETRLATSAALLIAGTCMAQESPSQWSPVINSPESYQLGHS